MARHRATVDDAQRESLRVCELVLLYNNNGGWQSLRSLMQPMVGGY